MGKNKISLDGSMELAQVITYLEDVLQGLKAGTVHVQLGGETVTLYPASVVECEMELAQKKDKEKISIELSWKQNAAKAEGEVKISPAAPRIEIS